MALQAIALTLIIDTAIAAVLLLLFYLILQPCVTIYNTRKKESLKKQALFREHEIIQGAEIANNSSTLLQPNVPALTSMTMVAPAPETVILSSNQDYNAAMAHTIGQEKPAVTMDSPIENSSTLTKEHPKHKHNDLSATRSVWWQQPLRFHWHRIRFLWHTVQSLFAPSYRRQERERMAREYGRDIATYFIFQQQLIFSILICSLLVCVVLIPIHMTGTRPTHEGSQTGDSSTSITSARLERISLAMRVDEAGIQAVHVCLSCLFVGVFSFFFVYRYMKNSVVSKMNYMGADTTSKVAVSVENNRRTASVASIIERIQAEEKKIEPPVTEIPSSSPLLKSPFSVMIDSVPIDMDHNSFYTICYGALQEIQLERSVAQIVMVPNFVQRVEKEQELMDMYKHMDQVDYLLNHKKNAKPTATICCGKDTYDGSKKFRLRRKYDASAYYDKQVRTLERDAHLWDNKYVTCLEQNMSTSVASFGDGRDEQEVIPVPAHDAPLDISTSNSSSVLFTPKGDIFETPRCGGVGYIVFTSKDARKQFCKKYGRTGINITKRTIGSSDKLSSLKVWQKKKKQLRIEESGNSVKRSKTVEYSLQRNNALTSLDLLGVSSMRVKKVDYEPEDINWMSVFQHNQLGSLGRVMRTLLIYALLLFILIFVSTPTAAASGIQEILTMDVIKVSTDWIRLITGAFGAFFFQYLPSLILMISTIIVPRVIIALTMAEKRPTHSETQRKVQVRIYIYLILSVVILPSLSLVAVNGVFQYFGGTESILNMFANVFLPSSGAFFVSFVLHQALLKNTLDLYMIGNLIVYGIKNSFTGRFWQKTPFARHVSPITRYDPVESAALNLSLEYSYMHLIVTIILAFAVLQPVIMVCGLFYFLYKYFVDRYRVMYVYTHKRNHSFYGTTNEFRLDFLAHMKGCLLNIKLIFGSLFVFTFLQTIYYALKIAGKGGPFVAHTVVLAVLAACCLLCIPLVHFLMTRTRKSEVRENNLGCKETKQQIYASEFDNAYEPKMTYPFLPNLSKANRYINI